MPDLQVNLNDSDQAAITNLKTASGMTTDDELVKTALQVYNYFLDQTSKGRQVYLGEGGKAQEVVTIPKK